MLDLIKNIETHIAANTTPYPLAISHGDGLYVFDFADKAYIDMVSGIGVVNFGHNHPRLVSALTEQAQKIAIVPRLFHNKPLSQLLTQICALTNMDKAIPMNSGAEAVETAIKVIRKWAYTVKNIPIDQAEIIVCDNSFHGRTVTTVSMSICNQYKNYFGPLTPGFKSIPFNNTAALEKAITANTAAFLIEPIQGEAGIIIPDKGYLKACERICKQHGVLLIIDEIQTGIGRTGKLLASQHENIEPDGILLGKALGGGLLPISLFLAKNQLMNVIKPGDHGSTFGGNPLASFVAYTAINTLLEEKLCENATKLGTYFLEQLKKIENPAIKSVRGKGLMLALEIDPAVISHHLLVKKLISNGFLSIATRNNTIRLLPPLTINQQQVDAAITILKNTLNKEL